MEEMTEDTWSPNKHLHRVIERTLANPTGAAAAELEICLKKYTRSFSTILKNPPKNEHSRNDIITGITSGIPVSGNRRTMTISKDLAEECLIISDMFDLDEFIALELLCTAQRQLTQHPGLTRGLVAILLYYDGRKAISCSLRDLFQVTTGVSWVSDVPKEIADMISSFTQCLVDDANILEKLIDLLGDLDISKESVLLTKNRALGPKKHQNQVLELFEDIRLALATALFNWSAQRGLPKNVVIKLIDHLYKYKSAEATGAVDDVTLTMLMALMYSYDTSIFLRQDNNPLVHSLPVINETYFSEKVYDALMTENPATGSKNILQSISKFSFGLAISGLRHVSQNMQRSLPNVMDNDEQLIDDALQNKVFEFIYHCVLEKEIVFKTEFFVRRIHSLLTDFIDFMHSKVTELRGRADETARIAINFTQEGLEPPNNLDHNFEMLMLCIGKLYKHDPLGLSLSVEYWGPLETALGSQKSTNRSVSLFKFIRLAGELLPPSLFVPYLKMIAGLTSCRRSARHAFNLLKQSSGLSGSTTLSWEHFFGSLSRYFSNLRQENNAASETVYKNRSYNRCINPQEIDGIKAVLEVIGAVATYDEIARIAICEHPNWSPLHVLIGLLGCSVTIDMKADILKTLSAFGKSKETATLVWNNLEASQMIAVVQSTNMNRTCHLEEEIDQIECRMERFPLTQSLLDLLYSLALTDIPRNLGAENRNPGIDPYLSFIINGIFLKFNNRIYKNVSEKWIIGGKCLKLLHYFLEIYEVSAKDFDQKCNQNPSPGYHIMVQLHTKSDVLSLILLIIEEARMKLDEYNKFHGKDKLEEMALYCLKILEIALKKQDLFFDAHSNSNCVIILYGLKKMLFDINPRSKTPDYLLNTTKFVTYVSWLPLHALEAVKILITISKQPKVYEQLLGILMQSETIQTEIRQGFVECLESELPLLTNSSKNMFDSTSSLKIELKIKEEIIKLLQYVLTQPTPNIANLLLGFDSPKFFQDKYFQKICALDSTSNCTRSLIAILDNNLKIRKYLNDCNEDYERLIECTYGLLYTLCSNQKTSDVILRYLRSCNDFLSRHLTSWPFANRRSSFLLNQLNHLLKCAAIDLKVTASFCQISRFHHLCDVLVGRSGTNIYENTPLELSSYIPETNAMFTDNVQQNKISQSTSNLYLCNLLDYVVFDVKNKPDYKCHFFDNTMILQIMNDCEMKMGDGYSLINIKKLHEVLNEELSTVKNTIASGQRKLIQQEIESILLYALEINDQRRIEFSAINLMSAWIQLTETLLICAPEPALSAIKKNEIILEILQKIFSKVVPSEVNFELFLLASESILLLLVNLRYQLTSDNEGLAIERELAISKSITSESSRRNVSLITPNLLNFKFILKNILQWIVVSGIASQKLRINLYAALLNCLRLVQRHNLEEELFITYPEGPQKEEESALSEANQVYISREVFSSFGDKLIDIICHDSITGHNICKMLALSCLDTLLTLEFVPGLINIIENRGYLSHMTESLYKSDGNLCHLLQKVPVNMKSIYVYETKMAMILRLCSQREGAELLLKINILGVLAEMKAFDLYPDLKSNTIQMFNSNEFIPSVHDRFRQILFPALNLCDCIISTVGSENYSAISQVTNFIISHYDMVEIVLRYGSQFHHLGILKELSLITGLIARISNQETFCLNDSFASHELGMNLHRLQRLMLSIFSRFVINSAMFKEISKEDNFVHQSRENRAHQKFEVKYFLEIAANLTLFCRNAITNHSADHQTNVVLFGPKITNGNTSAVGPQMTPSVGVLLDQLKGTVEYFIEQKSLADNLLCQISALPNISFDVSGTSCSELTKKYYVKQNELKLCVFVCEQSLFLLWLHLDFYMRRCAPHHFKNTISADRPSDQDVSNVLLFAFDDISILKKTLILIFNETFCKQLTSTFDPKFKKQNEFQDALLRRIKTFIQFVPSD